MPLTVAEAAMPPVEVEIEDDKRGGFSVRVAGRITILEDLDKAHTFYLGVVIGIEASGRRANVTGLGHLA